MGARILRRPLSVVLCAIALVAPTWSCLDATEIDLRITTDELATNIVAPQQAQILIGTPAEVLTSPSTDLESNAVDASGSFGDLVVAPNGDINADVALRVVLGVSVPTSQCSQSPQGCIVASRTIRYVPHHKLVLPIALESKCLGVTCQPGSTCAAGACVDDTVDTNLCDGGTCGSGSLGDGSTGDATVDAANDAKACATPLTCGNDTCVDLSSDPRHCGACNIDCSGGTCVNGTCEITTAMSGQCLGVWNGTVYVIDESNGLYTVPANGGAPTPVGLPGTLHDVTTLREADDLAYSYASGTNWSADDKANNKTVAFPSAPDRIALDGTGFAWIGLAKGQVGYTDFTGKSLQYGTFALSSSKGWLTVAAGVAYASLDGTSLCRATSIGTDPCLNATSPTPINAPSGVAVSDAAAANPSVYVVENGSTIVRFDAQLATRQPFAGGGSSIGALAWDQSTSTAYGISDGAVFKSAGSSLTSLVKASAAVQRCVVVDKDAVYWLQAAPSLGVFKHFK